jgi:TatD DNase family protein
MPKMPLTCLNLTVNSTFFAHCILSNLKCFFSIDLDRLFATVGCHPTRCNEFEESASGPEGYLQDLLSLIKSNKSKVVAIGECGLDYERLNFCDMETQKKYILGNFSYVIVESTKIKLFFYRYFELQIGIIEQTRLPLFLHCRGAANDMIDILRKHADQLSDTGGVIHSFDGTWDEAKSLLDLGYYIGINGWWAVVFTTTFYVTLSFCLTKSVIFCSSLKTDDNLEVLRQLPLDKLLIETDAPWCEIRPSHASSKYFTPNTDFNQYPVAKKPDKWKLGYVVKSRNEPCFIQ